ncbi:hypothetical protein PMAYCL1PPCAC_16311, partial [Pristionchus mayeri]
SLATLPVSILLECCNLTVATAIASGLVFRIISVEQMLLCMSFIAASGLALIFAVLSFNRRIDKKLGQAVLTTAYSISRAYQIKENIHVIQAILRLAFVLLALNVPIMVLEIAFRFFASVDGATSAIFANASMDVFISIYPMILVTSVPFSDVVFERSLKRLWKGQDIFDALAHIYRFRQQKHGSSTM